MHSMSKRVEYRGEFAELTDSLSMLPAGGQVLLSDSTFQRIGGRLHEVKLPVSALPAKGISIDHFVSRRPTRASLDEPRSGASASVAEPVKIKTVSTSNKGLAVLRVDAVRAGCLQVFLLQCQAIFVQSGRYADALKQLCKQSPVKLFVAMHNCSL